jgi:flagellar operon protein
VADPVRIDDRLLTPLQPIPGTGTTQPAGRTAQGQTFAEVLQQAQAGAIGGLKFSAHAQTRIQSRQIPVTAQDVQRIEGAVQRAAGKGSRDSLVLLDNAAFVVSVTNKTVITVVDRDNLKDNVFTNIDSAVIA